MSIAEELRIAAGLSFPDRPRLLWDVAEALRDVGARHALVGGLAVGALSAWPRTTTDVDLTMWAKDVPAFLDALRARFGDLEVEKYKGLSRVKDPAIDIIEADAPPLRRQTLQPELLQQVDLGGVSITLPVPESEMVMKYASILSLSRSREDTHQDITDLTRLILNRPEFDVAFVVRLAKVLRFRSPKETAKVFETLKAGGDISVSKRGSQAQVTCIEP